MPDSQLVMAVAIFSSFILAVVFTIQQRRKAKRSGTDPTYPIRVLGVGSPAASWIYGQVEAIRHRTLPRLRARLDHLLVQIRKTPEVLLHSGRESIEFLRRFWQEEVVGQERRLVQICFTGAAIGVNVWMGYVYADQPAVKGWQLWVWLGTVIMMTGLLVAPRRFKLPFNHDRLAVVGLFVLAIGVRAIALIAVPIKLHGDEYATVEFTMRQIYPTFTQTLNPFISGLHSQPVLFDYIVRASLQLVGYSVVGLRVPSMVAGALAVLATFFLSRITLGPRTAWLAAGLMICYQYHLQWSRIGLNNIWATLWVPLVLACFLWGWREQWNGGAVFGGIALGLTGYFYAGGAVIVFLLPVAFVGLWLSHRSEIERRRLLIYAGKMIAMAVITAGPLLAFALLRPEDFFFRSRDVFMWTPDSMAQEGYLNNYLGFFGYQLLRALGSYLVFTDGSGFYDPGIPFLIGIAGPLAVAGVIWAIFKKQYLFLAWLVVVTILGGVVVAPGSAHMISVIPVICIFIAAALNWLIEHRWTRLAYSLFAILVTTELIFYFGIYAVSPHNDLNMFMPPLP